MLWWLIPWLIHSDSYHDSILISHTMTQKRGGNTSQRGVLHPYRRVGSTTTPYQLCPTLPCHAPHNQFPQSPPVTPLFINVVFHQPRRHSHYRQSWMLSWLTPAITTNQNAPFHCHLIKMSSDGSLPISHHPCYKRHHKSLVMLPWY